MKNCLNCNLKMKKKNYTKSALRSKSRTMRFIKCEDCGCVMIAKFNLRGTEIKELTPTPTDDTPDTKLMIQEAKELFLKEGHKMQESSVPKNEDTAEPNVEELQDTKEDLRDDANDLRGELTKYKDIVSTLEQEKIDLKKEVDSGEDSISSMSKEIDDLHAEIKDLKDNLDDKNQTIKELKESCTSNVLDMDKVQAILSKRFTTPLYPNEIEKTLELLVREYTEFKTQKENLENTIVSLGYKVVYEELEVGLVPTKKEHKVASFFMNEISNVLESLGHRRDEDFQGDDHITIVKKLIDFYNKGHECIQNPDERKPFTKPTATKIPFEFFDNDVEIDEETNLKQLMAEWVIFKDRYTDLKGFLEEEGYIFSFDEDANELIVEYSPLDELPTVHESSVVERGLARLLKVLGRF